MGMLRFCCLGLAVLFAGRAWAGGCQLQEYGSLPVEMVGARATTVAKVNGTDARFILDTGASRNLMSAATAGALKLETRFSPVTVGMDMTGIGGSTSIGIATVNKLGIVGLTLPNVQFLVGGSDPGYGVLGANLLDSVDLEIDLAGGKITLFKAEQCGKANLAYWVKDGGGYNVADLGASNNSQDLRTFVSVTINGRKARALLDSGATVTMISRSAAEDAGIKLDGPDVKASGPVVGLGSQTVKSWIVNVDSFAVGTETIRNSQMEVIDGELGDRDTDMLLGVDFLLSHRMYIANSAGKAFFTYNGGRVFSLAQAPSGSDKTNADAAAGSADTAPKTAGEYALRGEAHLSRGEPSAAIADLNEAVRLAPDQADYYLSRARAQLALKQADAALADLGHCLSLDPKNPDALLLRAQVRLWQKDHEGAAADAAAASALVPAGTVQARSLASLYIELGQPAVALPMLDDWIRLHGDDAMLGSALNQRCWARSLSNQMLDEALKDCRDAIRRDGEKPAYLDSLGMVELRLGHYPESIKAYEQAVAANPRGAWSRYGLGMAKIRSGQTDAGNADLAAAHALDPQIEVLAGKYGLAAVTAAAAP